MNLLKKTALGAACCCAVALLGVGMWQNLVNDTVPDTTRDALTDLSGPITTMGAPVTEELVNQYVSEEEKLNSMEPEQNPNVSVERPADMPAGIYMEAPDAGSLSDLGKKLYGGCYVNGNRLVVVITEDRPENRQLLCEQLGLQQESVDFVTGKYSLAYLTWLQDEITARMMDGSFPFVVASGVYEMQNRVGITVTTEDQALVDKVLALDTVGGAIMVEAGAAPSIDLPLAPALG